MSRIIDDHTKAIMLVQVKHSMKSKSILNTIIILLDIFNKQNIIDLWIKHKKIIYYKSDPLLIDEVPFLGLYNGSRVIV